MAKQKTIMQVAIFDDTVENVQYQLSGMYLEFKLKPEDIVYRQFDHYFDDKGEACVFAVIEYLKKFPTE
tara:strand:- start:384 stop:590 length:207 start_codon:yes stop_codon:yes gene_type:complete